MEERLKQIQPLMHTLTQAIGLAEEFGYDSEVNVLLLVKSTIIRRAQDEEKLAAAIRKMRGPRK